MSFSYDVIEARAQALTSGGVASYGNSVNAIAEGEESHSFRAIADSDSWDAATERCDVASSAAGVSIANDSFSLQATARDYGLTSEERSYFVVSELGHGDEVLRRSNAQLREQ